MIINEINLAQHKFAVVGLGDTGVSIINYLRYKCANLVKIFDTRDNPPHLDVIGDTKLYKGKLDYRLFDDIDIIVVSPGISIYEDALSCAIKAGKLVIGDIELFAQAVSSWNAEIIGITGSNGKTTVTTLIGYLLKSINKKTLVAGNIGKPVLDSYLAINESKDIPEFIILELSSFQLETTYNLYLNAATVLNISEDHLDRYRDLLEYAYVKANIFNNCKTQILNKDDIFVSNMARHSTSKTWFGKDKNAQFSLLCVNNNFFLQYMNVRLVNCASIALIGVHNYLNCLASLALLNAIGINIKTPQLIQALCTFQGVPHRMQKVLVHNGITYIDDSKGTNVGAVIAGVSGIMGPIHLILGGDGKGQDFTLLRELVKSKCKSVAIIGKDKEIILKVLRGLDIPIEQYVTLEEAVMACIGYAVNGDSIILSPACASWDMFDNYKHRAKVFIECIHANIK
jgi:UDP-N-acetylmuramoylalanine--D-glutamate ligase